jgi:prophage maintenance system killer protein
MAKGSKVEDFFLFCEDFYYLFMKIAILKAHLFSKKNKRLACALKTALKPPYRTRYDIELKSIKSS